MRREDSLRGPEPGPTSRSVFAVRRITRRVRGRVRHVKPARHDKENGDHGHDIGSICHGGEKDDNRRAVRGGAIRHGGVRRAVPTTRSGSPSATPLSTFSIDVDTASYTNVRRFLIDERSCRRTTPSASRS